MKRSNSRELLLLVLAGGIVKSFGAVFEIDLLRSFSAVTLKVFIVVVSPMLLLMFPWRFFSHDPIIV